jgi:hypothetical protein
MVYNQGYRKTKLPIFIMARLDSGRIRRAAISRRHANNW